MKNLICIAVIAVAIAVGCSGGKETGCVGKVSFGGKSFEGKANGADEAKRNACNMYCRNADPEYDARYRVWLDSPKGKAAGSPSKQEAIFKDKDLLDFVTVSCANRCLKDMNPEANCGK